MSDLVFDPHPQPTLAVLGTEARYPVARIFCVGRNYAAHAAEMGNEVDREAPFYFTKSCYALLPSGEGMPYPPGTSDLHHEIEFVVALGPGGQSFGYASGLDMTRRDLQAAAKEKRRPWDTGKDFERSAIIGPITPAEDFTPADQRITLDVGGDRRQEGRLSEMVWSVDEIISHLGTLYTLGAGDLIMTGTPSGVGAVVAGDFLKGGIDGLEPVEVNITQPAGLF